MMITRFNAGCKKRPEGKGKFTAKERLGIGAASAMGIPYGIAQEEFDISRTYYHDLGKKADCALESLCASEQTTERVIALNKAFRERLVVALTCYGMSAANITAFAEEMFAYSISGGTIWNTLKEASRKAETAEKSVSLENIKHIATDEAFQNGEPVLTGADLDTGYVFPAQAAPDRSAGTWKEALEEKKTRGLNPELNVSDGGSGLTKGVREAFPEIETQLDIFHALRDLGNGVRSVEQAEIRRLSKLFDLEYRIQTTKTYLPTKQEYDLMNQNTPVRLLQSDTLRILFDWLREYTAFSGRSYQESVSLCEWILDEMAALYPKRDNLQKQIRRFRQRLPDLLAFLPRLQRRMRDMACQFHTEESGFALLYAQQAWDYHSEEYRFMEKKLYHIFGERLPEARETLTGMIRHTYRSGSPDENVNGRLRVFMNAGRGVPSWQLPLYQMFLNMKKAKRSRRPERIGTSALERLTGQSHPNFLDALLGPPNYILSAP
jgi:hypothetical protein